MYVARLGNQKHGPSLKGRNSMAPFEGLMGRFLFRHQGRRALRLPLAIICRAFGAGFHIPRLALAFIRSA